MIEHTGRVFRLQFDEFQIVSSSHDDTILIWDFLNPATAGGAVGANEPGQGSSNATLSPRARGALPAVSAEAGAVGAMAAPLPLVIGGIQNVNRGAAAVVDGAEAQINANRALPVQNQNGAMLPVLSIHDDPIAED